MAKKTASSASASNPTWYSDIRHMFTPNDINHMRSMGVDLSDYDYVKNHASQIYQQVASGNMPRRPGSVPSTQPNPNAWPKDWVATFLKWMTNGCPKGMPAIRASKFARMAMGAPQSAATRIRKDVTKLSATELTNLKKAFSGIMALDATDPNNPNGYFLQAGIHWMPAPNTWCMHHVPGYNPWHRAYLLSFENALRSIPGCQNVTLPYWDITKPLPKVLQSAPFDSYTLPKDASSQYKKGYKTNRYTPAEIQANLLKYTVTANINRALSKTDWEDFHGYIALAPNNTIINAHDMGHNSIGPTMQDQDVAAFDPIFWFFHCNWDRLFWKWQKQMQATNLNGLLSTINKNGDPTSYQTFTVPALQALPPFALKTTDIIDSRNSLDVDYQDPVKEAVVGMLPKTQRAALASQAFSVNSNLVNVRVQGLNRLKIPGGFNVHLMKEGKVIASTGFFQPNEVEKCENCVKNAIVHFDFELPISAISKGQLEVWVEPNNKEYVGDYFPHKMMGNPTIDVHLLMSTE